MNLYKVIENDIREIISQLQASGALPENLNTDKVEAAPPREEGVGDMATNVAMVLAAQVGKSPREIANLFVEKLSQVGDVEQVEIAGPGFINLTLDASMWQNAVKDILAQGRGYGASKIGAGKKVNVEYVSANPTGPMHVGHARYIYGDAVALLLQKAGFAVTKEYYINDAGAQVDKLANSLFFRYREALGHDVGEIAEGLYPGDYLVEPGKKLAEKYGDKLEKMTQEEWLPIVRDVALESMMELIKSDLASLGIFFDVFSSERAITAAGKVQQAIDDLKAKNLIYTGVLEAPKGKTPDDWEARPQMLFRATEFGDDLDRPVQKSDGSWTYFAPDIAYQRDKIERGFDQLIMLLGVDHGGYVKRLKAAVNALSGGRVPLEVKLCQLVKFMRAGEPLKMSKRAGTFVTVREVVDEVGKDVFRFIMLTRKNDVPLDFDLVKVTEQSKDNPVFYVQYAHARARSVLRTIAEQMPEAFALIPSPSGRGQGEGLSDTDGSPHPNPLPRGEGVLSRLTHPAEIKLIRLMCQMPRLIESAALACEPHRVAFYAQELAAGFHGFWALGNEELGLRFLIKDDIKLTAARAALASAVSQVIASSLLVLGVDPVEEMR
ncbi:MAG: arginine--tRNA ligase [Alphaproteobacteria bacterium]|nr:arginine--tRNA ligase [Alphaproteobacteria bacterium]